MATAALLGAGAACSWSQNRPVEALPAEPSVSEASRAPLSADAGIAPAADLEPRDAGTPVEVSDSLLIRIQDVEGTSAGRAGAIFADLAEPVQRCRRTEPGLLRVRVQREGDHTTLDVAPGSNVDPATRHCVLEAISSLQVGAQLDEQLRDQSTPSTSPHPFASTVSISW